MKHDDPAVSPNNQSNAGIAHDSVIRLMSRLHLTPEEAIQTGLAVLKANFLTLHEVFPLRRSTLESFSPASVDIYCSGNVSRPR